MGDIVIVTIILVTFILRILPSIFGLINSDSGDINFHLLCAKRIRENGFKHPKRLASFILPGVYDYPPLFHYLLALIPHANREKYLFLFSPLIDVIHVVIIYYFVLYIQHVNGLINISTDINVVAAISGLLFATSPALLYYGIGPRSYIATPRTLGELFVTIIFISQLIYFLNGNLLFLFLACFFSSITLLTSKFGSQVLIFFSLGFAVYFKNYEFMLLPGVGILLAVAISRGKYIEILNGWIRHSILLKEIIIKKHRPLRGRNDLIQFRNLANAIIYGNIRDFEKAILELITNNTYIILFVRNILLFFLIKLIIDNSGYIYTNMLLVFLIGWILISLFAFLITSLKPFLFLGESERYIEYSIPLLNYPIHNSKYIASINHINSYI